MPARYRADQVGSFLRPPEVLQAHRDFVAQKISAEERRRIEDEGILKVLDLQKEVGIDVYSDGEYRRGDWAHDFADSVEGYVPGPPPIRFEWQMAEAGHEQQFQDALRDMPFSQAAGRVVGEKLRQTRRLTAHESGFLKEHAPGPFKITFPAASYVVARGWRPGISDRAYGSRKELLDDVVKILRAEVQALVQEGVPYIQMDNPHYPDYIPEQRREEWRALGIDPDRALAEDVEADSAVFEGVDRDRFVVATHVCRGNGAFGAWHTQGGYEPIAEQVFGNLAVDTFLLEYDSERAGGFEPLRHLPRGKNVVLGLVTTKMGELESQDTLLRRIEEASKYVPMENLSLSPQCGFASMELGNPLSWDQQRRKLELVVETARRAWS